MFLEEIINRSQVFSEEMYFTTTVGQMTELDDPGALGRLLMTSMFDSAMGLALQ